MKKTREERKRDRRGSAGAKLAAWIGITMSAVAFLGGVIGTIVMEDTGVYDIKKEDFLEEVFEEVAGHYAVRALDNMENADGNLWSDTIYRYGIIKAEEIDNLDLNDDSTYVVRNFHFEVTQDMLYMQSYEIGENTQFNYSGTLWGGYSIREPDTGHYASWTLDATYYNEENGIFYYEAGDEFFPVRYVSIQWPEGWGMASDDFRYDYERGMYYNLTANSTEVTTIDDVGTDEAQVTVAEVPETTPQTATYAVETGEEEAAAAESDSAEVVWSAELEEILSYDFVTFDMLIDVVPEIWEYLILDGYTSYTLAEDGIEIYLTNNEEMKGVELAEETEYEIGVNRQTLEIYYSGDEGNECYWVVSILPEDVAFGWSRDMFVQANAIVTVAYGLRYTIYPILAVILAIGIFCFVWLLGAAGQRKGTEEITATWLDLLPFDLYLVLAAAAEWFLALVLFNTYGRSVPVNVARLFLFCCLGWVLLLSFLTIAVRVKLGNWWRNTICHRIYRIFSNAMEFGAENISILGKTVLIFAGIAAVDFFFLAVCGDGGGIFFWLLIKLAEFALLFRGAVQLQSLKEGGARLAGGDISHPIDTGKLYWEFRKHAENLNSISSGMAKVVDERMKSERFKTELITNVSHDIKTPLTSIINYVDLLEKEELSNETAVSYLEVLERQSGRLKKLIEDLIEASKASTGNLAIQLEKLEAGVSMVQTIGEFEEKLGANELELLIVKPEEPVYIMADARHLWRVIDNLMNNICKYAQPGTRVYINLEAAGTRALLTFRNTSRYPLNISSEELMERFVRGDSSRNTEGSGLGISIAKSLMELMGGSFELYVDGDLFKVIIGFDRVSDNP